MRLSSLVSVVLAPVLVALVAAPALAAAPSASPKSAVKRVAKRSGAAPYVLPAPKVEEETLPPLPPPPPAAPAPAWLPPPTPAAPVAGVAAPEADVVSPSKQIKPTGGVFQLGIGTLLPTNAFVHGLATLGPGVSFDFRVGAYASPHFGFLVGGRGSYGHKSSDCPSCDSGYSLQVPVMFQFAQKDRSRGLYGEIGLGFATRYGIKGDNYMMTLSTPVELKLGLGYRLAGDGDARKPVTLDINAGMDIGEMQTAEARAGGVKYEGPVDGASTHVVMALSLLSHFSL